MDRNKLFMQIAKETSAVTRMSRAEVDQLQEDKFRKILKYAAENSPYYREAFKSFDLSTVPITDLPILTKDILIERFDDVVTSDQLNIKGIKEWMDDPSTAGKLYKDRWCVFKTSGTTGQPAVIISELSDNYRNQAAGNRSPLRPPSFFQMLKFIVRGLFKPWPVVVLCNPSGYASSGYVSSLFGPDEPRIRKTHRVSSLDSLDRIVEQLNKIKPIALLGTPFMLETLATQQLEGKLKLKLNTPFSVVGAGAEVLHPKTRKKVFEAWGVEIMDTYGSTECGVTARNSCDYKHLHLMSDMCILEVVDNDNNPVPDGEYGDKVLLTNLNNIAQPLIRYEISDMVAYADPDYEHKCHLPFPILKGVKGRRDHHFTFEDLETGKTFSYRHEFFLMLDDIEVLDRYRLRQIGQNHFELNYTLNSKGKADPARAKQSIMDYFQNMKLPVPVKVDYIQVEEIRLSESGKSNMFENLYKLKKES